MKRSNDNGETTNSEEWEEWLLVPQDEIFFVCSWIHACSKWNGTNTYYHRQCGLHPGWFIFK